MVKGWTCERCSATNAEASLVCSNCGATRPNDGVTPATPEGAGLGGGPTAAHRPGRRRLGRADHPGGRAACHAIGRRGLLRLGPAGRHAPDAPPAPAVAVPRWRRLPIGWLLVGVIVAAGAVGGFLFNASRSSTGEINKAGDLVTSDLRVGDCFDLNDPSASAEIEKVTARPCSDAHQYEIIFVGSLPAGTYPPEKTFEDYVGANCIAAFATYVGSDFDTSTLDMNWLFPTEDA